MAVLGLQGVRGGVGTTTITAALAWSLQMLGENVLHQQALPDGAHILINDFRIGSQVQDDIYQLWLQSQRRLLPMLIHRDEAMAECLAAKQPVGEFRSDALAAEEILTLANWCLLNYSGLKTPVGSAS